MPAVARLRSSARSSYLHEFKVPGESRALRRNAGSVGGGAAAVFNTRASKPSKLSAAGLVLVLEQSCVSLVPRRPHYTSVR